MDAKTIFRKALPFLVFLAIIAYEILSGMGAFSGRLGITSALRQSEAGWIYLDKPATTSGIPIDGATRQYTYYAYPEKGATDVIVMNKNHQVIGAISFADSNKGDIRLTVSEEIVFICLRNGRVAVLDRSEVVEILTAADADARGIG